VSDSDVIIHLAKLNELTLISELYGGAYIPEYVESEMVNYQYDEAGLIKDAIQQGILKVHKAIDSCNKLL
jgi:predicted nucleic acid-binding protein